MIRPAHRGPSREFLRFCLVGAGNTAVDLATFLLLFPLLAPLGWAAAPLANTLAFAAATVNSFIWNGRWTFRRRGSFGRMVLVALVGLQLGNLAVVALLALGLPVAAAKAAAIGVMVAWNYGGTRQWVFGRGPARTRQI